MSIRRLQNLGRKDGLECSDEVARAGLAELANEAWWNVAFFVAENEGLDEEYDGKRAEDIYGDAFIAAYSVRKGWAKGPAKKAAKRKPAAKKKKPAGTSARRSAAAR